MVRLVIALVSVINATAALAAPRMAGCSRGPVPVASAAPHIGMVKVQRPPRVPRREPFEPGPAAAAGMDG
jgi:hypothetical protein